MAKEFKTIDELISILESRGVITDSNTRAQLMRESYYAIVNGYKRPFLDLEAMKSNPGDVYKPGTKFEWIYTLFLFDRDLRNITFKYLAKAEAIMKSAAVYAFCKAHQDPGAYLLADSYASEREMLFPKGYRGDKRKRYRKSIKDLLSTLRSRNNDGSKPFIRHYSSKYGFVPLWVLSNNLTFGNMAHFYQLQKRSEQNEACRIIVESAGGDRYKNGRLTPHDVLRAFNTLSEFRNLCAHDDRLYCAKVGKGKDVGYSDMVATFSKILPKTEVESFVSELNGLFRRYGSKLHAVEIGDLIDEMGFETKEKEA